MNWYIRKYSQSTRYQPAYMIDDIFQEGINDKNQPAIKEVKRDPAQKLPVTLTLYRGFDADIQKLKRQGQYFILSPRGSEQGMLWFTCNIFQNDAEMIAKRGRYLLTYPLPAVHHVEKVHYSDGSSSDRIPGYLDQMTTPTDNSRYFMGYELPQGWFFSYKVQKYIVCDHDLSVSPDMISMQQH